MRAVTQTAPFRHGGTAWMPRLRFSVTVGPRGCPDCAFPSRRDHRVRLYVSVRGQNALLRKLRFFSPGQTWRRLTEKRILLVAPHGKAHSVRRISRKSALCMRAVTQTASLRHGGTAWGSECAFPSRHGHRMRLCVSVWGQNALFRKVRFFSPGQTRRRLTEKRILQPAGHGKAHSTCALSRKSAVCVCPLTE